jgi:hypothetical protein
MKNTAIHPARFLFLRIWDRAVVWHDEGYLRCHPTPSFWGVLLPVAVVTAVTIFFSSISIFVEHHTAIPTLGLGRCSAITLSRLGLGLGVCEPWGEPSGGVGATRRVSAHKAIFSTLSAIITNNVTTAIALRELTGWTFVVTLITLCSFFFV